ncbi:hypothetical protein BGZ47_003026 [Haplosporangium gracile]|nr:hypothetical protein BGZ47_003026 [Haplosporangium gracile]
MTNYKLGSSQSSNVEPEEPSSNLRREITNQWLHVAIPALKTSTLSELRQAGSRLTNEWTLQEHDRDAFWLKVTADEEQKDRIAHLKAAGEKRLKAAEGFLVAESQYHFEMETAQLKNLPDQQKDRDHPNQQQQQDKDQQQEEGNEEESQESNVEQDQTPPEGRLPQKKRKVDKASEYGDVSDTGRKVDLIFMYKDIELFNVEFKRTDISSKNITVQCRKNIRLGRCLQGSHAAYGFKDASVIMGDVAGM